MNNKKQANGFNLRDLLINNPQAKSRKAMREIDEQIRKISKNSTIENKQESKLWAI
jgi:hypothetical protein